MAGKDGIRVHVYGDYDDRQINKAIKDLNRLKDQAQTSSEKFAAFGESMATMGKKLSLGLTLPIVGAGIAAVKLATDFDTAMTKIVSLVGISTEEVAGMRESVLKLSGATGKSADELADALFVVTSAGLRGSAAIKALDASAKASASGLGETADIARSVAGAMNAYGPAVLDAARATDIIVATARAGNFETSQFAAALGGVLPFAKQAGASLEDVGGAVALLTRTNGDAAQSVTQVTALMRAFVVPTEEAKKALGAAGLSASDMRDRISKDGLASALTFLDKKLGGNREQLGKLLGSSEAAAAAFQILDADSQTLASTFGDVTDSVGINEEAFAVTADTAGNKMQRAFNDLKLAMIGVGDVILPLVSGMAEKVSMLANGFTALPGPVKNVVVAFGALLAAVGPVMFVAGKLMTTWVAASAGMSAAILRLRAVFGTAWASMSASAQVSVIKIKVAMMAAQTQMGALGAGAKAAGLIAVGAFKSIGLAAKGLLVSLGPVGIGLMAVTAVYSIMAGRADDTKASVEGLTEALSANGDQAENAAKQLLLDDLMNKHRETIEKFGLSYTDAVDAIMGGADAQAAFRDQLMETEVATFSYAGSTAQLTSEAQGLLSQIESLSGSFATATDKSLAAKAAQEQLGISADGAGGAIDGLGVDALGAAGDLGTLQTETKKLSDLFLGFDKDVAAIRAKDEFRGFLRDLSDELPKTNRNLFGTGEAAEEMRGTILDALDKAKTDAVAWGEANGATLSQVETRFQKNATTVKKTLGEEGFKKKDLEKFFGSEYVDVAGVSIGAKMITTIGTLADRLGPAALREFKGVGLDLGNGIALGVAESSPQIDVETRRAITNAERAARAAAQSNSPSKLFAEIGKDLARGLAQGAKSESETLRADLQKTFGSWYDSTLETLRGKVKDARQVFNDFKAAISGQLVDNLNIGTAFDTITERQAAADAASKAVAEARAALGDAPEQSALDKVNELQAAYDAAVAMAATNGGTLIGEFNAQAQGVVAFSEKMRTLMSMGLDPILWQQIYSLGADKGTVLVDNLIAGGVETINESNAILDTVKAEAERIGLEAAAKWEQTGIDSAKATVKGFVDKFGPDGSGRKRLGLLMDRLANSMNRETTITVNTINRVFTQTMGGSGQPLAIGATGGIVNRPTFALIGEAGPEAVIPLNRTRGNEPLPMTRASMGGASTGGNTINLTVHAGMGSDGYEIGRIVVDSIKKYERVAGPVFAGV